MNNEVSVKQVRIFEKLQVIENQRLGHSELITVVLFFCRSCLKEHLYFLIKSFCIYILFLELSRAIHIFYKTIFSFPFSGFLICMITGLKTTSLFLKQINPFANRLRPRCEVMQDGLLWRCLKSNRIHHATCTPVQERLYCFRSALLLNYLG